MQRRARLQSALAGSCFLFAFLAVCQALDASPPSPCGLFAMGPADFGRNPFTCRGVLTPRTSSGLRDLIYTMAIRADRWYDVTLLSMRSSGCGARIVLHTEDFHVFPEHFARVIEMTATEVVRGVISDWAKSTDMTRHPWMRDYLSAHGSEFDRVFMVDAHDIYFERDPFEVLTETDSMVFFEEGWPLRVAGLNMWWLDLCFGQSGRDQVSHGETLCSGTIYGGTAVFQRFLDIICQKSLWQRTDCTVDQPILNWLVYSGALGRAGIKFHSMSCTGPVLTLARCPRHIGVVQGIMVGFNAAGVIPYVVHQWRARRDFKDMYVERCDMTQYIRNYEKRTGIWLNWSRPIRE